MDTSIPRDRYDVLIVGGGVAGLTLALELVQARPGIRLLVAERAAHPVPEATHKVGESTVEIAAHYLRDVLGLGDHLHEQQLAKFGLRIFFSDGRNDDITRRVELGHARRPPHGVGTFQIDRGRLENELGRRALAQGVVFRTGAKVEDIALGAGDAPHAVRLRSEQGVGTVDAAWIVDASGRAGVLRRQLGLGKSVDHHANAVWFRIGAPLDIDAWDADPDWHARILDGRRELSTNHLMGPGYWVWLIRLASDSISVGIVTDPDLHDFRSMNRLDSALSWLAEHEPQCAAAIEAHRNQILDFRVMRDYSFSATEVMSDQRWCLTGESGVFLDPLYSPGLDLIAVSNGLITDLICHALDGEDVSERAAIHNQMFLTITDGWLEIYQHQYKLLGNARVMTAKTIWDTAAYWAVPGLLYFHDMVRRIGDFPAMLGSLARFSAVGAATQRFLREWAAADDGQYADCFVGFYDFDFMPPLHIGMTAQLPEDQLLAQLDSNVRLIEQLTGQLIDVVATEFEQRGGDAAQLAAQWRADAEFADLVAVHRADRSVRPTTPGWITLGRELPEEASEPAAAATKELAWTR
jgi:flavin-dependent dehydrogenase